jgi:hypothetical protein
MVYDHPIAKMPSGDPFDEDSVGAIAVSTPALASEGIDTVGRADRAGDAVGVALVIAIHEYSSERADSVGKWQSDRLD